ncbi:S-adenosylmethionine-dependent methyltransferase [Pneumocystis jirovecii RU7]|uniref:Methyltransferase small domain-containing protein n=1 Tax=Pneumocystis jirovecii (strain RU7) TaxID=1408657 RepID=A0A0W4ZWN4_PNEJ7|nr:S-adenosylmethionine-dependent methyltransferase [Pneumocystis jirovecii RU7]KTW32795.1 hypothetical protein T551_00280 [Pneumocystis jirovecii RU7]
MFPTPKLSHLHQKAFQEVYEPSEDTFILLDALEHDLDLLRNLSKNRSGSGCVSVFLQTAIFGPSKSFHLCTDISLQACKATLETSIVNSDSEFPSYLDVIHTDLTQGLYIINKIDLLVFNPPYVPTESKEIHMNKNMENTWAGGIEGMEITYKLLNCVNEILSDHGLFYLVAISKNKPKKIADFMRIHWNMESHIVLERKTGLEKLYVIRFNKTTKHLH